MGVTTITYGGNTIATLSPGQTFTSSGLTNKVAATDIIITADGTSGEKTIVTYNGNTLFEQQSGTYKIPSNTIIPYEFAVEHTAAPVSAPSITVTGLGNEDPATVTFTEAGIFDWNFEEVTDNRNNIFVKIPTMYRKVNTVTDGQITSFILCDTKIDDSYEPYPCFLDSNGNILPYVLIGRFCCSSVNFASSNGSACVPQSITTGRENARALGTGYQIYDWQIHKLFVDLALCRSWDVNFNNGHLIDHFLGVEQLDNNIWVDGVYQNVGTWYYAMNPADYVSNPDSHPPTGYNMAGYNFSSSRAIELKSLGYDTNSPFFNLPSGSTVNNTSYNTYYCDVARRSSRGSRPVISNIGGPNAACGLWFTDATVAWSAEAGVRLCKKPL